MSQLLIHSLEGKTVACLKRQTQLKQDSLQGEMRYSANFWTNAGKIRACLLSSGRAFSDSAELVQEDRDC